MKLPAFCLLAFASYACSQPETALKAGDCILPSRSFDTTQIADFKQYMRGQKELHRFIPQSDTMYCFAGKGGWGEFDYLCSVYQDSTGYKAALTYFTNVRRGRFFFDERVNPIGPLIWRQVQADFAAQNFWCNPYREGDSGFCSDCSVFYIWAKEGKKERSLKWDEAQPKLDSLKILAEKLRDLCGFPPSVGEISYSIRRDSIYASIYSTNFESKVFTKKTEIYYDGRSLRISDGLARLVVPRKDFNNLKKAEIIEHGIDGSVHRFRVSELREEKN